jgi:hypothetical protein
MAALDDYDLVLHTVKAKLYKNHLQNIPGNYTSRTANERTLYPADICTSLKIRANYPITVEDMMKYIDLYHAEEVYQMCDGFAVCNGYYTKYLNIGGTFESPNSPIDPETHRISVKFGVRRKLWNIINKIKVEIIGIADTNGYIDYLVDHEAGDIAHNMFVPGDMVAIYGSKIKIAGDHPDNGVWFIPVDDQSGRVKMDRMGENTATKIIGLAPVTSYDKFRLEIRTQYNGTTNTFLKEPRVITSEFILEHL